MAQPKRRRGSSHVSKGPEGLQWSLDQESEGHQAREKLSPAPEQIADINNSEPDPESYQQFDGPEPDPESYQQCPLCGGGGVISYDLSTDLYRSVDPPPSLPTLPPSSQPCLYDNPMNRETVRRNLEHFGVTNIHQLLRTYQTVELVEAINDYQRALKRGFKPNNPTAYFWRLLE